MSQNGIAQTVQNQKGMNLWDHLENASSEVKKPEIHPDNMQYTMHNLGPPNTSTVHEVPKTIVIKIMDYCHHYTENPKESSDDDNEINSWEAEYFKIEPEMLFQLMETAHDFKVDSLVAACKKIARINKEKYQRVLAFNPNNDEE